jgi:hypothetical protein
VTGDEIVSSDLLESMVTAARGSLGKDWHKASGYLVPELTKLADQLAEIASLRAKGEITEAEARTLLRILQNTRQQVQSTGSGLTEIAVENAINAALGAVRKTVNTSVGFVLL